MPKPVAGGASHFWLGNEKSHPEVALSQNLAEWTGLEPATPGVTGRYSNQLNYHSTWRLAPGTARNGCERVALAV